MMVLQIPNQNINYFLQEQKQQEKLAFERHLEEKQKEHAQLLLMNNSRKENMINSVRQVHHMLMVSHFILKECTSVKNAF